MVDSFKNIYFLPILLLLFPHWKELAWYIPTKSKKQIFEIIILELNFY